MTSFARLPVSMTISLSLFKSLVSLLSLLSQQLVTFIAQITITPPPADSPIPVLTISIPPSFTLDLMTTSLLGSRAKLADVPKLHELIQHQVRRVLAAKGTWKVVLPGLGSVAEAKDEIKREHLLNPTS
jgi:maintenance of mitochondrial morphology protein 1